MSQVPISGPIRFQSIKPSSHGTTQKEIAGVSMRENALVGDWRKLGKLSFRHAEKDYDGIWSPTVPILTNVIPYIPFADYRPAGRSDENGACIEPYSEPPSDVSSLSRPGGIVAIELGGGTKLKPRSRIFGCLRNSIMSLIGSLDYLNR